MNPTLKQIIEAIPKCDYSPEIDLEQRISAESIAYTEKGLVVGGVEIFCDRPRLAFARVLMLYQEPEIYGHAPVIGGPGFGYERDENGIPIRIPHLGNVIFGENVELGSNVCIDRGVIGSTIIGDNVKIDNLVHIAHNAKIGKNTLIVAGAVIGGSAEIGENCFIGMNVSVKQKVKIGNNVTVGAGAVVLKDIPDGETWVGNPARKLEK